MIEEEIDLIARIKNGETTLFSRLLKRYQHPIFSLVRQIVACKEDAEEVTQDVFVKAYKSLSAFRGDCSFSTWLYRIAYNTAISATRKKMPVYPDVDDQRLHNLPDNSVDEQLEREADEALVIQLELAIDRLTPEERSLIALYYTADKPITDVAGILQLSPENVKVKLFRIRKKLVLLTQTVTNETD